MHTRSGSLPRPTLSEIRQQEQTAIRIGDDNGEQTMVDNDTSPVDEFPSKFAKYTAVGITSIHLFLAIIFSTTSCQHIHWGALFFLAPQVLICVWIFSMVLGGLFTIGLNTLCCTQIDAAKVAEGIMLIIFVVWTLSTPLGFYLGYYKFECVKELN